jgi:hypothetical protein
MEPWSIVAWRSGLDRSAFDCGRAPLNDWLEYHAGQAERRDSARTFLALDRDERIIGYISLCVAEVTIEDGAVAKLPSKYPVPAVRLAR